jgi:hypothetical protein
VQVTVGVSVYVGVGVNVGVIVPVAETVGVSVNVADSVTEQVRVADCTASAVCVCAAFHTMVSTAPAVAVWSGSGDDGSFLPQENIKNTAEIINRMNEKDIFFMLFAPYCVL